MLERPIGSRRLLTTASLLLLLAQAANADDKLIQVQKVTVGVVNGNATLQGVGKGPFTDAYPNGIDMSGKVKMQKAGEPAPRDMLAQSKISPTDDTEREFGSIGAKQGSVIVNDSGKAVKEIDITTQGNDGTGAANNIDPKSTDGDDFDTEISKDGKTIKLKAKPGKELGKDEQIWIKMPKGPQPGDKGDKIYKGKVVLAQASLPVLPWSPTTPKAANESGTATVSLQLSGGIQTLSFLGAGNITNTTYADGSGAITALLDPIIGSQLVIDDMVILGQSAKVVGAWRLSDSALALVQNGQTVFHAELVNALLIPDPLHPGSADIMAALGFFSEALSDLGSRYLDEYFQISRADGFVFHSDLLSATNGLTIGGSARGSAALVGQVAEPGSLMLLLASAIAGVAGGHKRRSAVRDV